MNGEPDARDALRTTCRPCRGTGRVISGLGGEPHQVTCPWCGGSGEFAPGSDAQQSPAESTDDVPAENQAQDPAP